MSENIKHDKINGEDYKNLIISAAQSLEDSKEEINDLNVFPVPDGDTGSNMSMTVGNAAKELLKNDNLTLDQTAEKTAKAMLHGARGNSGVIVSLLFRGIAKGLKNSFECDGIAWAEALKQGVEAAYGAVDRPAEGTILTVARKCAEAAEQAAKRQNDFEYVLGVAIEAAEKALDETINQNPVLEKAGVVDAGGMGWLVVMKAMHQTLKTGKVATYEPKVSNEEPRERADFSAFETEEITFGFCTEFIVRKHDGDSDTQGFKKYLNGMGDSLVMLDDGEIIKVHVHTNEPHAVLGEALKYGVYETVKVENMRTQHTNKLVEEAMSAPGAKSEKEYGFVSVASGSGIEEMFKELGVDIVVAGGQTMNPSCEDIYNAVCQINAKNIFILPNNKNIIMTSNQVSEMSDKNIKVIPTRSVPQGFSALLGFDLEADVDANFESMSEMAKTVDTMQVTYAARNSNFDGLEIKEGDYLSLYNDKLLKNDSSLDNIINALADKINESEKSFVSVYYGEDVSKEEAEDTLFKLEKSIDNPSVELALYQGNQPVYYYIISAE
ncbi:MAG: DAK2 domain-containing protein [Ruminococcaceae bacterium]|nr:DAK2 domain-containing protein [Oscillospiraceae bacterium]